MNNPWTPGPWRQYVNKRNTLYIIQSNAGCFVADCNIGHEPKFPNNITAEANAHLISSAPELYAALEWIADNYAPEDETTINQVARDAMKKARGEQ